MKVRNTFCVALFSIFCCLTTYSQNNVIDSLKLAFSQAKHDTTRCTILNQMIEAETEDNIWILYNDQLLKLAEKGAENANSDKVKNVFIKHQASAYNNWGIAAQQEGNNKKALDNIFKSLGLEESIDDKEGISVALMNIGYIYNTLGDIPKAMDYWHKSLEIQEKMEDKQGMAYSLNNMGSVYHHQGDIHKALDYLHRSLKIQEEIDDKKGISNSLNNIAGIYGNQGDHKKALEYYQRSLKIREGLKDQRAIGTSYNNIGYSYTNLGNIDKAMEYYEKSLKIREGINDRKGIANSLTNIGSIYNKKGDVNKALDFYKKGLAIQSEIGHKEGISTSNARIAELLLKKGQVNEALTYALVSFKISRELGFPENITDAASILKDIYRRQNKFKEAFDMHELEIQMRDSLTNAETKKESVRKSFQYQYEKKAAADSVKNAEEQKVRSALLTAQNAQLQKERTTRIALFGGILLITAFSIFVFNRFRVTRRQKEIIEEQKEAVEKQRELADARRVLAEEQKEIIKEKQKEIIDSIQYASKIQQAILTGEEYIAENFKGEFFIFYQPKDIVSGDFYWAVSHHQKFFLLSGDCTGHGVPGAFMSLLNISYLNENVVGKGLIHTADILNEQRTQIVKSLNPTGLENSKDGMDCVLCAFDIDKMHLEFSAANSPLWLIRKNEIMEIKGDKMPVGKYDFENKPFSQHSIDLEKGDMIYIFTDGFADQFGGANGKKFMYKKLKETLLSVSALPMNAQRDHLDKCLKEWMGNTEQVDDITVIGVRV